MPLWNLKPSENRREKLCRAAYICMALTGAGFFFVLTVFSLFYTQYMLPGGEEIPVTKREIPLWNLLVWLVFCLLALLLKDMEKKAPGKVIKYSEAAVFLISLLWVIGLGIWWITALDRIPEGDQAYIYGGASYFLKGDYSFFVKGGYCQIYPQQLGQIAAVELIFSILGVSSYFAIQVLCVLMAGGVHVLGYFLLREYGAGFAARLLYLLLMMGCLPLICYTGWVYGDLPSVFFMFCAAFFTEKLHGKNRWYYGVGAVAAVCMAVLVRNNSLIFCIAFAILSVLYLIRRKKSRMLVCAALMLLSSFLAYRGIYGMYEVRSGISIGKGLPANSWIAMGMQESRGRCGWHNNMPKETGEALDWDYDAVKSRMWEIIRERSGEFLQDPGYAVLFYTKKAVSQWNQPLFQSVFFSASYSEENGPEPGSFLDRLYHTGDGYFRFLAWADRWHFLIFSGTFLYFVFCVRSKEQPMSFLFAVTVIGGFLFSLLWEAKARYILPYYLMMYPMAVMGHLRAVEYGKRQLSIFLRRRGWI